MYAHVLAYHIFSKQQGVWGNHPYGWALVSFRYPGRLESFPSSNGIWDVAFVRHGRSLTIRQLHFPLERNTFKCECNVGPLTLDLAFILTESSRADIL